MLEEEKDQKQILKLKVKQLEQQIVERTRNFMQSSRLKSRNPSISNQTSANSAKMADQNVQTDIEQHNHQKQKQSLNQNSGHFAQLDSWFQDFASITAINKQQANQEEVGSGNRKKQQKIQNWNAIKHLQSQQALSILELARNLVNICKLKQGKEQLLNQAVNILSQFKQKYLQIHTKLQNKVEEIVYEAAPQKKRSASSKKKQQNTDEILTILQKKYQFIKKALNQSQQSNYELRLQLQQRQIKLRKFEESNMENLLQKNQEMKIKIEQTQIIKKEYLKAYSKVKQQKQQLQLKFNDLQQELQKMKENKENQDGGSKFSSNQDSPAVTEDEDIRLKTIIQHSQDEVLQQVLKQTSNNSFSAIKQIIEHGLLQSNRSTSQKWIKSALVKLEQYDHNRKIEYEKLMNSQHIIELSIHQNYKNLLASMLLKSNKEKSQMQQKFNKFMDKIIHDFNMKAENDEKQKQQLKQQLSKLKKQKQGSKGLNRSSQRSQIYTDRQSSMLNSKQSEQEQFRASLTYDLVSKLNQANQKYSQLKVKYEEIIKKQQEIKIQTKFVVVKYQRPEQQFAKFMSKIINEDKKVRNKNLKFTQQFFERIAQRIFQTLCNLPTGGFGQIFFVPTNQQQLEEAVEAIFKFSLQYDKYQQARLKQFKSETESLTKILEQIAVAKEVSPEMVIESMHNNLKQQSSMAGNYVKSLIKKLSEQQNEHKKIKSQQVLRNEQIEMQNSIKEQAQSHQKQREPAEKKQQNLQRTDKNLEN